MSSSPSRPSRPVPSFRSRVDDHKFRLVSSLRSTPSYLENASDDRVIELLRDSTPNTFFVNGKFEASETVFNGYPHFEIFVCVSPTTFSTAFFSYIFGSGMPLTDQGMERTVSETVRTYRRGLQSDIVDDLQKSHVTQALSLDGKRCMLLEGYQLESTKQRAQWIGFIGMNSLVQDAFCQCPSLGNALLADRQPSWTVPHTQCVSPFRPDFSTPSAAHLSTWAGKRLRLSWYNKEVCVCRVHVCLQRPTELFMQCASKVVQSLQSSDHIHQLPLPNIVKKFLFVLYSDHE